MGFSVAGWLVGHVFALSRSRERGERAVTIFRSNVVERMAGLGWQNGFLQQLVAGIGLGAVIAFEGVLDGDGRAGSEQELVDGDVLGEVLRFGGFDLEIGE